MDPDFAQELQHHHQQEQYAAPYDFDAGAIWDPNAASLPFRAMQEDVHDNSPDAAYTTLPPPQPNELMGMYDAIANTQLQLTRTSDLLPSTLAWDMADDASKVLLPLPLEVHGMSLQETAPQQQQHKAVATGQSRLNENGRHSIRKQNRACDPCRLAKKACYFPSWSLDAAKTPAACTMCRNRGYKCTMNWLANKKAKKRTESMAAATAATATAAAIATSAGLVVAAPSATEAGLAQQVVARGTCNAQFSIYVEAFEVPLSQCLWPGSTPPHYHLGVSACTQLINNAPVSGYFDKATEWIQSCWQAADGDVWSGSEDTAPHVFRAVSLLDAVLNWTNTWRVTDSRNASITQTYKWVAMASAAQYATGRNTASADSPSRDHDLALATYRKARSLLFSNVITVGSFRLAFSMLLFGTIQPPGCGEEKEGFEEDANFARYEGARRLRLLCGHVRSCLCTNSSSRSGHDPASHEGNPNLSSEVVLLIMQLIIAIEWLVNLISSTLIGTSYQRTTSAPACSASSQRDGFDMLFHHTDSQLMPSLSLAQEPQQKELEEVIIARAQAETEPFLVIWKRWKFNESNDADSDAAFDQIRGLASLSVLVWKALARLTVVIDAHETTTPDYDTIRQLYCNMNTLVQLWRASFGTFDATTKLDLYAAPPAVCRMLAFCSDDTDLAILLFCDLAQRLQTLVQKLSRHNAAQQRLLAILQADQKSREDQQRISAIQIATIAATDDVKEHRISVEHGYHNIRKIAVHPSPRMIVLAHSLAAKILAAEICQLELPSDKAANVAAGLQSCMRCLQDLRESLVVFPNVPKYLGQSLVV